MCLHCYFSSHSRHGDEEKKTIDQKWENGAWLNLDPSPLPLKNFPVSTLASRVGLWEPDVPRHGQKEGQTQYFDKVWPPEQKPLIDFGQENAKTFTLQKPLIDFSQEKCKYFYPQETLHCLSNLLPAKYLASK